MERNQMDVAVHEIHQQVQDFLKICSNASFRSVSDVVEAAIQEKFNPNRYEGRILQQELGRAYDRYTKEKR